MNTGGVGHGLAGGALRAGASGLVREFVGGGSGRQREDWLGGVGRHAGVRGDCGEGSARAGVAVWRVARHAGPRGGQQEGWCGRGQ